jgi:hypothetical protein
LVAGYMELLDGKYLDLHNFTVASSYVAAALPDYDLDAMIAEMTNHLKYQAFVTNKERGGIVLGKMGCFVIGEHKQVSS